MTAARGRRITALAGDGSSLEAGACREAQPVGLPGRREPPDPDATRRLTQVRRHGSGGRGRRPPPGRSASPVTTAFSRNRRLYDAVRWQALAALPVSPGARPQIDPI